MSTPRHISPDDIRKDFSRAMSDMYREEVPLYGALLELVAETNARVLANDTDLAQQLQRTGEIQRLDRERHGAIRLGTALELATISRLFAVMGMQPVGYYDLTPAGVPVHSTAFRAVHESALQTSPFRVFTSLLRLELIENLELRTFAEAALAKRSIFTPQALETFRWHHTATVSAAQYQQLSDQHRLIADVVAFKGPHINHLTPRTLDIDRVQADMPGKGITPKAVIEGPPRRQCPILLRQTSFKALDEAIAFTDAKGSHSARFGEIEQRGVALTPKGRALYDQLLNAARDELGAFPNETNAQRYSELMEQHFQAFADNYRDMREQGLAFFRYFVTDKGRVADKSPRPNLDALLEAGHVAIEPLVYEDFLPVSAAGIFQSNLGDTAQSHYAANANQAEFEQALGRRTIDELQLYADTQQRSIDACLQALRT